MSKYILFDVDATGSMDGATDFTLPRPLAAPNANTGQIVVPVTSGTGSLGLLSQDDPTMRELVGTGGFWLRAVALNNQQASVTRFLVGLTQPKPSLGPPTIFQTWPIFAGITNALVNGQRTVRRGVYVPPGWRIVFRADDGNPLAAGVQDGPYQVAVELETLPKTKDVARAIRSQDFPREPITIDTT